MIKERYDVIIIGAGGGGPVVAKELAEQGLEVLHLEAGPYHRNPDYTDARADAPFFHSETSMKAVATGRFRWGPRDRTRPPWPREMDRDQSENKEGLGFIAQIAGVGGTTLHYTANCPRAYPRAVEEGQWPSPYKDLVPYYERVEAILPVSRDPDLPTKDAWFLFGAHKAGLPQILGRDVHSAGWRPQYNAILPPGFAGKGTGCTQCGHCIDGCIHPHAVPRSQFAKRSTNVSYVPHAEAHSNYTLLPDAFVTQILTESLNGELVARGVRWRMVATGEEDGAFADVVVLAAGAIESPRLWLNSGLPNSAKAVGRYLTLHWHDFVTGVFDHAIHPHVGQNSQSRVDIPGFGALETIGFGPGSLAQVCYTLSRRRAEEPGQSPQFRGLLGAELWDAMEAYDRTLPVFVMTDDEMDRKSRVSLGEGSDEHGPVPRLAYNPTEKSRKRRDYLCELAAKILKAAGATRIHRADWPPIYNHMQSSMRMGRDPYNSVVDGHQESWEVKRLFVTDASSLPDALGGPNPTLTIQMFATRTAEYIATTYFDRDPFVLQGLGVVHPAGFPPGTS